MTKNTKRAAREPSVEDAGELTVLLRAAIARPRPYAQHDRQHKKFARVG